ncbi:TlpA family protein disulfide reductase [Flammeovirga sp. SubArs3]|uniref:TlpA family protein disulfide reductase n=1 Tax=Flammeovirga sp. SubArs3 TaxID=2995316 RepID=UPI00248B3495|nr:TlpA family protein disulfide reductase [Flammeovirga sp. SubArs3]
MKQTFIKILSIITVVLTLGCEKQQPMTLQPSKVISIEQQDIPYFNHFDQMSNLLSHRDDTLRVINYWATWCKPCVQELPFFLALDKEFKDKGQKAKVILVSLDMTQKPLENFIKRKNITTQVFWLDDPDANYWVGKVNAQWDGAIPVTQAINKNKSLFHSADFSSLEEIKQFIQSN